MCSGVTADLNVVDPISDPSFYNPGQPLVSDNQLLSSKVGTILGATRSIGIALGVVALTIIGFRYMLGSADEKAEYKETMMPYMIGAILLITGTYLVEFIYQIALRF